MLAKTGAVVIWHWAHEVKPDGCAAAGKESDWHLGWKAEGAEGTQEIARGNRRADILAPGGFAVEFQRSPMTAAEVLAREADWKRQLVWVFDGSEAREDLRLELFRHPSRHIDDAYRHIRWAHMPERVYAATCTSLIDLGDEGLLYVGRWYEDLPRRGYGWLVPRDWVVINILQGGKIPTPPGYAKPVLLPYLTEKARREAGIRRRQAAIAYAGLLGDGSTHSAPPRCVAGRGEPRGPDLRLAGLCADCGRATIRSDDEGRPRCSGTHWTDADGAVAEKELVVAQHLVERTLGRTNTVERWV